LKVFGDFCWILKWSEDICKITMELDRIVEIKGIERNVLAFDKRWIFAGEFGVDFCFSMKMSVKN
jgi:hypothetical protein